MALYNQGNKVGIGSVDLSEVNKKIDSKSNKTDIVYKNLLNPTLYTTTLNGVTCTNNGDGTYTLNGTATASAIFTVGEIKLNSNIKYRLVGCPSNGGIEIYRQDVRLTKGGTPITASHDIGNGSTFVVDTDGTYYATIRIANGINVNNLVFKPMITTQLSATSDDFVASVGIEISRKELELAELKMLGWNVPKEMSIQNEVNGNQFVQRIGRVSLIDKTWTADGIGQGSIKVYRFEIPSNCKTYSNSAKWNIYVEGYKTLPLVLGYSGNDVASHDMAVGGRNAGGNFIEFSTTKYSTVADFKAYMDASGLYLYYELATPITKNIDGNENPNMVSSKLERFVAPSTDAELLALPNGIYSINVADVGTSLFPNSWGTLVVLKSGFVYGTMLYIGANAKMYFRNINNGAWREASWTALN